jgi:surfeit locus 1 family protein
MIAGLKARGLLWPTVMTVVALPILLALGTWQLQRKAWKEDLIARVNANANAAPVSLQSILSLSENEREFRPVRLRGTFEHAREFHVWAPRARDPAWQVVTPLRLEQPIGRERRFPVAYVLVIRGIVPQTHKAAATRQAGQPAGVVEIVGRTRRGSAVRFAKNNAATNEWVSLDLNAMRADVTEAAMSGAGSASVHDGMGIVAPIFVEAGTAAGPPPAPQPDLAGINLTNRHLEYALTWYGLAATLIGVYFVFARAKLNNDNTAG